jgi:hypothetical protein
MSVGVESGRRKKEALQDKLNGNSERRNGN